MNAHLTNAHATNAPATDHPERLGGGAMFDRVAPRYDRLNALMSFGLHRLWRRRLVAALGPLSDGDVALDLATGTADVALAIARRYPGARVVGVDPSPGMLAVGDDKVRRVSRGGAVTLEIGDGQALGHADDAFAASCIAFGIRNVPDRPACLAELARVTRPGGPVAVLELSWPRAGLLGPLARFHVRHVVPRLGAWLSGEREYRYLAESVAAFPAPAAFASLMGDAGLVDVRWRAMAFGTATLFVARAP